MSVNNRESLVNAAEFAGMAQQILGEKPVQPEFTFGDSYSREGKMHLPVVFPTDAGAPMMTVGQAFVSDGSQRHEVLLDALQDALNNDTRLLRLGTIENTGVIPEGEGVELVARTNTVLGNVNSVRETHEAALQDLVTVVFNAPEA